MARSVSTERVGQRHRDGDIAVDGGHGRHGEVGFGGQGLPAGVPAAGQRLAELDLGAHGCRHGEGLVVGELEESVWIREVGGHGGGDIGEQRVAAGDVGALDLRLVRRDRHRDGEGHMAVVASPCRVHGNGWPAVPAAADGSGAGLRLRVDVGEGRDQRVVERELHVDVQVDAGDVPCDHEVDPDDAAVVDGWDDNGSSGGDDIAAAVIITAVGSGAIAGGVRPRSEGRAEDADTDVLIGAPRERVRCPAPVGQRLNGVVEQVLDEHLLEAVGGALRCTRRRKLGR